MSARRRAEDDQPGANGGAAAPSQVTSSPGSSEKEKSSLDSDFHRYVLWGVALALLLALGLFCWLVVVPVMQVRRVLAEKEEPAADSSLSPGGTSYAAFFCENALLDPSARARKLGGPRDAAGKLGMYLRMPERVAPNRVAAVEALYWCGSHAVPVLLPLCRDEDKKVRQMAVRYLGLLKAQRAVDTLLVLLVALADEEEVRCRAAWALGEIGDRRAVDPLIKTLRDESRDVRYWSAAALGKLGDRRATLPLAAAVGDRDDRVRYRVVVALGEIGDERAMGALLFALHDGCSAAAEAISQIRPHQEPSR